MGVHDGYYAVGVSPPVVDSAAGVVSYNPFGSVSAYRETTYQRIIDTARTRHWAFAEQNMPDAAAFENMRQREREVIAQAGAEIEGLLGSTLMYAIPDATAGGTLVRIRNGVPYLAPAGGDGWPVHLDENDLPYVDPTEPQLAGDPLQFTVGGLQGFPLPGSMIRLVDVKLVHPDGRYQRVTMTSERRRTDAIPGQYPVAFVSNNRLVPMTYGLNQQGGGLYDANAVNNWRGAAAIQVSWVPLSAPFTLTDLVMLPDVLIGVLTAYCAKLFSMQAKQLTPNERQQFRNEEDRAIVDFNNAALGMLSSPAGEDVVYEGW